MIKHQNQTPAKQPALIDSSNQTYRERENQEGRRNPNAGIQAFPHRNQLFRTKLLENELMHAT